MPRLDQIENMQIHEVIEELKGDQEIYAPFRNHSTGSMPKYFIYQDPANLLSPRFGGANLDIEGANEFAP